AGRTGRVATARARMAGRRIIGRAYFGQVRGSTVSSERRCSSAVPLRSKVRSSDSARTAKARASGSSTPARRSSGVNSSARSATRSGGGVDGSGPEGVGFMPRVVPKPWARRNHSGGRVDRGQLLTAIVDARPGPADVVYVERRGESYGCRVTGPEEELALGG